MDVDTRLLRYFAAVAAEGNLTRAAERLFVSQPALTKQIKQLESQVGVRLFTRSRAGMTLTEAGQVLAGQVPALLGGWDQMLLQTRAAAAREARVLRVGTLAGAANEATQAIIADFARRRPGCGWRRQVTGSVPNKKSCKPADCGPSRGPPPTASSTRSPGSASRWTTWGRGSVC